MLVTQSGFGLAMVEKSKHKCSVLNQCFIEVQKLNLVLQPPLLQYRCYILAFCLSLLCCPLLAVPVVSWQKSKCATKCVGYKYFFITSFFLSAELLIFACSAFIFFSYSSISEISFTCSFKFGRLIVKFSMSSLFMLG